MSDRMNDTPGVHVVLQARHWPAMLNFTRPGDRLIIGGSALLAVMAEADLKATLAPYGLAQPDVLTADCEAYGITPCPDLALLDDADWVRTVAEAGQGVIQW